MPTLQEALTDFEDLPLYQSPWLFFKENERFTPLLRELSSRMELIRCNKNKIIFSRGDEFPPVVIVKKGVVRALISEQDGNEKHLLIGGPGCVLGDQPCLDGYPSPFTVITAEENCELYITSSQNFSNLIETTPGLKDFLLRDLCLQIRVLTGHIESMSFQSAYIRIVRAILYLVRENGVPSQNGIKINVRFTHREMADLIYSNRVTVSKFFSKLTKDGKLEKIGAFYYVKDLDFFINYTSIK